MLKQDNKISPVEFTIEGHLLYLGNSLLIGNSEVFLRTLTEKLKNFHHELLEVDLEKLNEIDSIGVATLNYLKKSLAERNITVRYVGGSDLVKKKLDTFSWDESIQKVQVPKATFFTSTGEMFHSFLQDYVRQFIMLMANVMYWTFTDIFRQKVQRRGEFYNQAVLIGVNAVWIVLAMSFIIGFVLALQSSSQLKIFGANIYIVDLIVIAMMSEMGPLITAILIAGRSGSSIAAEIATMQVTSETDALKTMGIHPIRFVIIPKMHGSLVTMPFLTILADIAGILGGMIVAYFYLDITPQMFLNRMGEIMKNKDILTGTVKSLVYASIIVLTGSFYGLKVKQGAEGVGKVTTSAVVVSISLVFIADSLLGLVFY